MLPTRDQSHAPTNANTYGLGLRLGSHSYSTGSKGTPIALMSDGKENSGKRRMRRSVDSPNGKKKRRVA